MIKDCKLCDNFIKRHKIVNGIGNINSDIMFIFDHPRYKQDRTGLLRSDEGINHLMGYLTEIGVNEQNSYFTNLVKCRPDSIYNFKKGIDTCTQEHLSKEYMFNGKSKKLLVLVGDTVGKYFFPNLIYFNYKPYILSSSIIIVIDSPSYFTKRGRDSIDKLKVIEDTIKSLRMSN